MGISPESSYPPYLQIANDLRMEIQDGGLQPGDQLPPRAELAWRYGVARQTVQHAMTLLRHEGLVTSRQGSGVFVAGTSSDGYRHEFSGRRDAEAFARLTEWLRAQGDGAVIEAVNVEHSGGECVVRVFYRR